MRHAAAIPACAALTGAAGGVCLAWPPALWWLALIAGWLCTAAILWRTRAAPAVSTSQHLTSASRMSTRFLIVAVACGFCGAGGVLGTWDATRARHPSLIAELARLDLDPTTCGGQPPAALVHSCDIIADLEGTLNNDAATSEFGVTFTLDVDRVLVSGPPTSPKTRFATALSHDAPPHDGIVPRAVEGSVRVTVSGQAAAARMPGWRAGRRIRAPVSLRAPLPYRNVGVPDQRDRLALAGISLFGSIKSATLVEIIAPGTWWQERAADLRAWTRQAIAAHVRPRAAGAPPGQSAAVAIAVLIGDRAGLSAEVEQRLQRAGTYHVIAISGGNIAILTGLLLAVLHFLPLPPSARVCLTAALVWSYALIIDAGPSVVRATAAAVAYLLARTIDLEARSLEILSVVVFLMLLANPLDVVDAGFWLTCGATLGILLHAGPALRHLRTRLPQVRPAIVWPLASLVITTFFAELVLLPITAFTFSQITLAGLLLNIAAIPLMTIVQIGGMAVLAFDALGPLTTILTTLADLSGWLAHLAATALVDSASFVDLMPWTATRVPPPPLWLVLAYFASWAGLWLAPHAHCVLPVRSSPARLQLAMAAAWMSCLALIVIAPPLPAAPLPLPHAATAGPAACEPLEVPPAWHDRPWLMLTMIDVGQGGAAALQTNDDHALLVDTGGTNSTAFDIGARVVSPALWALGIRRLNALALSHADVDHIAGAPAIVRDFTPRELWIGVPPRDEPRGETSGNDRLATIAARARASGARTRTLAAGERISLGRALIEIWNPPRPAQPAPPAPATTPSRHRPRNDESLVLDVRLGNVSIVLPGDISAEIERRLVRDFGDLTTRASRPTRVSEPRAPSRVLAAPHHGSQASSSAPFLDAFPPRVVLISAGLNNRHGHPAPAALDRYRTRGIAVFRTDLDGAIQVLTDGATIHVATCSDRRATFTLAAARSPPANSPAAGSASCSRASCPPPKPPSMWTHAAAALDV